jgi:hypothetical protein
MKKYIIFVLLSILFFNCSTIYLVDKKTGQEWVLMSELNLTAIEKFELHWKTSSESPFAKYDSRSESFYYDPSFDYSIILKKDSIKIENRLDQTSFRRILLIIAIVSLFLIIILLVTRRKKINNNGRFRTNI